MPNNDAGTLDLLTLSRLKGIGAVRASMLLDRFGSPDAVFGASVAELCTTDGIGGKTAESIGRDLKRARGIARDELEQVHALGGRVIGLGSPDYPPLLGSLPGRPVVLSVLGTLEPDGRDRFAVGIVGSRRCTNYGLEQAGRFGAALAGAGLTVVSGGARGIDSAAHRGAITARGRTMVVLGCGLNHVYPPENRALFDQIVESNGCVVSEFQIDAPPDPGHFPSRNRIISGASLGVLVVEAANDSGALITARVAAEEHGREVFALPGRVDDDSIAGNLSLLKSGGAHLVTEPGDVLSLLESPAHHLYRGTHASRYAGADTDDAISPEAGSPETPRGASGESVARYEPGSAEDAVLSGLDEPRTVDRLAEITGLAASDVRRVVTMLELSGAVRRDGAHISRARTWST